MNVRELVDKYAPVDDGHKERYRQTVELAAQVFPRDAPVLDVGGHGDDGRAVNADCLRELGWDVQTMSSSPDLRGPLPLESGAWRSVLLAEVVEHIKDADTDVRERMCRETPQHLLREIARALAPGGRLLLTTPNGASISNAHRLASGAVAMMYTGHVIEWPPAGVRWIVEQAGLHITHFSTRDVWGRFGMSKDLVRRWEKHLTRCGYPVADRGDCIFVVAEASA